MIVLKKTTFFNNESRKEEQADSVSGTVNHYSRHTPLKGLINFTLKPTTVSST